MIENSASATVPKRKANKPKADDGGLTGRLEIRVDPVWLERVEVEAKRWGISVTAYIRLAVSEKMERDERKPDA